MSTALRPFILTSWVLACCAFASPASAIDMRCGTKLMRHGDSIYEVEKACGQPDLKSQRVELRTERHQSRVSCGEGEDEGACNRVRSRTVEVVIDEWTYDRGSTKFVRFLIFEQGKLVRVEKGRHGG